MARPPQLGGFLDAEVDGLPLSTAEEPEEPVEEVVTPHDFVVLTESGDPDLEYQYGSIATAGGDETVALIAIASLENRLLVAVPESAWHRTTARRKLPARALSRPNLVAVAGCKIGTRTEEAHIVVQIKVWTGFLDPRLERELDFTSQTTPTWRFGELEDEEFSPLCSRSHRDGPGELHLPHCGVPSPSPQRPTQGQQRDPVGSAREHVAPTQGYHRQSGYPASQSQARASPRP